MGRNRTQKRLQRQYQRDRHERYDMSLEDEEQGRRRKSWTFHDLATIRPLTLAQEEMFHSFAEGKHLVAYGSSGSGKSFLALFLALNEILYPKSQQDHIILVRSAVPTRDMGFVPGDLEEKMLIYERPYIDILHEIVGRPSTYDDMKRAGLIEFCTTSFLRSLTWHNAIVILDEGQSMTFHEIHSVITRLGEHSRLIFLGDTQQNDLQRKHEQSGMDRFLRVASSMPEFRMIHFTRDDIVRSPFVKSWIIACEEMSE